MSVAFSLRNELSVTSIELAVNVKCPRSPGANPKVPVTPVALALAAPPSVRSISVAETETVPAKVGAWPN